MGNAEIQAQNTALLAENAALREEREYLMEAYQKERELLEEAHLKELVRRDEVAQVLMARIEWLERQKFGRSSERMDSPDPGKQPPPGEPEAESEGAEEDEPQGGGSGEEGGSGTPPGPPPKKAKQKRPGHKGRNPLPDHLKRVYIRVKPENLTDDMVKVGEERTEILCKIPAQCFVKVIIREKYVRKGKAGADANAEADADKASFSTAPMPERFIPKGFADESLLAWLATAKYVDHLPLYRLGRILRRDGVSINDSTLGLWVNRMARELGPLYDALFSGLLQTDGYGAAAFGRRTQIRRERALPILNGLGAWLTEEQKSVLPQSAIGKAISYSLERREELTAYVDHPIAQIDNNLIENQIRPLALGRKNYLFAGSHDAAQNAAVFYSLFASAELNGLNPYQYLYTVLKRLPTTKINQIDTLLPYNFSSSPEEYEQHTFPNIDKDR